MGICSSSSKVVGNAKTSSTKVSLIRKSTVGSRFGRLRCDNAQRRLIVLTTFQRLRHTSKSLRIISRLHKTGMEASFIHDGPRRKLVCSSKTSAGGFWNTSERLRSGQNASTGPDVVDLIDPVLDAYTLGWSKTASCRPTRSRSPEAREGLTLSCPCTFSSEKENRGPRIRGVRHPERQRTDKGVELTQRLRMFLPISNLLSSDRCF